jgi:hypothetical protein
MKIILILVIVFFSLIIAFNLWMKNTLKETATEIQVTTTLPVSNAKEVSKTPKASDETSEELFEDADSGQEKLLLQ